MDLKRGERTYKLDKVSIYISELYQEYALLLNEDVVTEGKLEEARLEAEIAKEEAETTADRLRAGLMLLRRGREIRAEAIKNAVKVARAKQKEIIREVFTLNFPREEYNEGLWLRNISDSDFNDIMSGLLAGKKKQQRPST